MTLPDGAQKEADKFERERRRRLRDAVIQDIAATRSGFKAADSLPREELNDRNALR